MLLDDDKIDFINKEMSNVVLSIDGRKEVNDRIRTRVDGSGCYDSILPKFKRLVEKGGMTSIMSEVPSPSIIWILRKMYFIFIMKDLTKYPLSLLLQMHPMIMQLPRPTYRQCLRNMNDWQKSH